MLISLTHEEYCQLSVICQQEIANLLVLKFPNPRNEESAEMRDGGLSQRIIKSKRNERWVDLNLPTAYDLFSNLNDRNSQTLMRFAHQSSISIAELTGDKGPYGDLVDLKRSFVGAVNRRLRTVTEDPDSELFATSFDKKSIEVTENTKKILSQYLGD